MQIGSCKEFVKLTFQALALRSNRGIVGGICGLYTERWSCAIGCKMVTLKKL